MDDQHNLYGVVLFAESAIKTIKVVNIKCLKKYNLKKSTIKKAIIAL